MRKNYFFHLILYNLIPLYNVENHKLKMEMYRPIKLNTDFCDCHIRRKQVNSFNFTKVHFSHKTNWLSDLLGCVQLEARWLSLSVVIQSEGIRRVTARNFVRKQVACSVCLRSRTERDDFLRCADWCWVASHFLNTDKTAEKCEEWTANSIPAGVKNNTAVKLTASRCCFYLPGYFLCF